MFARQRQHALVDQLLRALDARAEAFAVCELARGWRLSLGAQPVPLLHYVLQGTGLLCSHDEPGVPFGERSVIIVPPNVAHVLDAPDARSRSEAGPTRTARLAEDMLQMRAGDGTPEIITACGLLQASYGEGLELFAGLKEPVIAPPLELGSLSELFRAVLAELAAPRLGTQALLDTLLKQCLILVLRRQIESGDTTVPWLAALGDGRLTRALAAMLAQPTAPFRLRHLAELAGMSRSAFALHFVATFGETPMNFLARVRLRRAARLLETTDLPVKAVAQRAGYASRSHFSRAFRRLVGADPTAFRTSRRPTGWRAPEEDNADTAASAAPLSTHGDEAPLRPHAQLLRREPTS